MLSLASHIEYAPHAVLTLEKVAASPIKVRKKMGQTEARTDATPMNYACR